MKSPLLTICCLADAQVKAQQYANVVGYPYRIYKAVNPMDRRYVGHHVVIPANNDTYQGDSHYVLIETVEPE